MAEETESQAAYRAGELAGRLHAVEYRLSRHEDFMGKEMSGLKEAVTGIAKQVNEQIGGNKTMQFIMNIGGALASGLIVAYVFHH